MTPHAVRRRIAFAFAAIGALGWARAFAQLAPARADAGGGARDPGAARLEALLETQFAPGASAALLPWRETILAPDKARLVWGTRSVAAPNGVDRFRVAIDPPTRWYYIAHVGRAGAPLTLYGPIDETAPGTFVDALGSAGAASPPVAKPKPAPRPKPEPKPKPKPTPKPKSSAAMKTDA